jgi:hypothetical protein
MSLQLKDFDQIKAMAIAARISPHQENLSPDELEIRKAAQQIANTDVAAFERYVEECQSAVNEFSKKMTDINHSIDIEVVVKPTMSEFEVCENISHRVEAKLENREPAIAAKTNLMLAESRFLRFKAENDLTNREAKYPESLIQHAVPIGAVTLAEVFLYTMFYRADGGILDGFMIALMIGAVNLVGFGALGYGSRYKNLKHKDWRQMTGTFCLIIIPVFIVLFNMVLALYRMTLSFSDAFAGSPSAVLGVITGNLPFRNIEPFLMWIGGMAISAYACRTGYTLDDVYPGYSDKDKDKKACQKEYDDQIAKIVPEQIVSQAISQLDGITRQCAKLQDIKVFKEEVIVKYDSYKNKSTILNHDLKEAIDYFRQSYLSVIAHGMTAPAYFSQPVRPIEFTEFTAVEKIIQRLDLLIKDLEKLENRVTTLVVPTIHLINKHKPKIALIAKNEYVLSVQTLAQERIFTQQKQGES